MKLFCCLCALYHFNLHTSGIDTSTCLVAGYGCKGLNSDNTEGKHGDASSVEFEACILQLAVYINEYWRNIYG